MMTDDFNPNNILILGPAPSVLIRSDSVDYFEYSNSDSAYNAYLMYCAYFPNAIDYLVLEFKHGAFTLVINKEYYREAAKVP